MTIPEALLLIAIIVASVIASAWVISFVSDKLMDDQTALNQPMTMDGMYGDGSDHSACIGCGYCATCGDCKCGKPSKRPTTNNGGEL